MDRLVAAAARVVVPALLLVTLLVALLVRAAQPLTNADTYFHLRLGQEILDGWSLRHPGQPSPQSSADWQPTQWLAEIVMTATERRFGLAGVAWLAGAWSAAFLLSIVLLVRRRSGLLVCAVVTGVTLAATSYGFAMRPQLISFALLAVTVGAWLRCRDRDGRPPWWLVPLTWLWATCHGLWTVGVVIGLVAAAALALDRADGARRVATRFAVPLSSLLAAALTPVGPSLLGAVALVGSRASYFSEWAAPDFTSSYGAVFLAMWALTAGILIRRGDGSWLEIGFLGLSLALAVYSLRTLPAATLLVAPILAARLQATLGPAAPPGRREVAVVWGSTVVGLAVLALAVPPAADLGPPLPAPVRSALTTEPEGTAVMSDLQDGGYLLWTEPQLAVVAHGYGDVFTDAELARNATILRRADGWVEQLAATGARVAVLRRDSALAYALGLQGWTARVDADGYVLLDAPTGWPTDLPDPADRPAAGPTLSP